MKSVNSTITVNEQNLGSPQRDILTLDRKSNYFPRALSESLYNLYSRGLGNKNFLKDRLKKGFCEKTSTGKFKPPFGFKFPDNKDYLSFQDMSIDQLYCALRILNSNSKLGQPYYQASMIFEELAYRGGIDK